MFSVGSFARFITLALNALVLLEVVKAKDTVTLGNTGFDKLLQNFNVFLFDADGVLWNSGTPIPGSPEFVKLLLKNKKKVYVISNGLRPISSIQTKLAPFTIPGGDIKIITPGTILPEKLKRMGLQNGGAAKTVFLAGTTTVQEELEANNFTVVGGSKYSSSYHRAVELPVSPAGVGALVVGMDADFDMVMARNALSCLASNPSMKVYVLTKDSGKVGNNVKLGVNSILALFKTTMPDEGRLKSGGYTPFTTEDLLAAQVKKDGFKAVFLVGDSVLETKLKAAVSGINIVGGNKKPLGPFYSTPAPQRSVKAVVLSIDFEFSMNKAKEILTYLSQNSNIPVIATGADYQMPPLPANKIPANNPVKKTVYPDVGGIIAFVKAALPSLTSVPTLGKPDQAVLLHLVEQDENSIENYHSLFIGDTLSTDIEFGNKFAGNSRKPGTKPSSKTGITQPMMTLLVGTGNDKMEHVEKEKRNRNEARVPNYYAASLGALLSDANKAAAAAAGRKK